MFGILNLNKPAGWTSRDVVNRVQRLVKPAKAGHAGTLDPLATGVLIVCVGPATRLISYVQQQAKSYEATFLLGKTSPSDDVETEVSEIADAPEPTWDEITEQLPSLSGTVQQRPPIFSALKVKGQRAYKLARQGEKIELAARAVEIYDLQVDSYCYPELRLSIRCGSGTYVRSIGRDLAETLGTGAVMSALTRTAIGDFSVGEALDVESLDAEVIAAGLISPLAAVSHLPYLALSESQVAEIRHGRLVPTVETAISPNPAETMYSAIDEAGQLVALVCEKRPGMLGAAQNFPQST